MNRIWVCPDRRCQGKSFDSPFKLRSHLQHIHKVDKATSSKISKNRMFVLAPAESVDWTHQLKVLKNVAGKRKK